MFLVGFIDINDSHPHVCNAIFVFTSEESAAAWCEKENATRANEFKLAQVRMGYERIYLHK